MLKSNRQASVGIVFGLLLGLSGAHVANAQPGGESAQPFASERLGVKLPQLDGETLLFRTTNFSREYLGVPLVEFRIKPSNSAPSLSGALLSVKARADEDFKTWAERRKPTQVQEAPIKETEVLVDKVLDCKPGEGRLREFKFITDFGTMFERHVYFSNGRGQFFQLVLTGNIREQELLRSFMDKITTGVTIAGVGVVVLESGKTLHSGGGVAGLIYTAGVQDKGQSEIFLLRDNETEPVNLTKTHGNDLLGAWSHDGKMIAFVSGRQSGQRDAGKTDGVYVMNADGSGSRRVIECYPGKPRWHPDGTKLLILFGGDAARLATVSIDGSGFKYLTDGGVAGADYSPDGSKIAVIMNSGKKEDPGGLFVMTPDGSDRKLIVPLSRTRMGGNPRWSPDGKQIIFAGNSAATAPMSMTWGTIMIVNADGTNLHWNYLNPDVSPMFLPKMNKIAYLARDHGGDFVRAMGWNVYVKNMIGPHPVKITNAIDVTDFDYSPLSADEPLFKKDIPYDITFTHILSAGMTESSDIYVMTDTAEKLTNLTQSQELSATDNNPCWSPDKKRIAFESTAPYWFDDGQPMMTFRNIWVMDANGNNPVNLTHYHDAEFHPAWSPDGQQIAFQRDNGATIWVMSPTGAGLRKVGRGGMYPMHMSGSRDGTMLVLGSGANLATIQVNVPDADWVPISPGLGDNSDPDWNPATDRIAYIRRATGEHSLRIFNFPGGPDAKVTDDGGFGHPSWSPNGCKIVVHNIQSRRLTIIDPHQPEMVNWIPLSTGGYSTEPDWVPDQPWHDSSCGTEEVELTGTCAFDKSTVKPKERATLTVRFGYTKGPDSVEADALFELIDLKGGTVKSINKRGALALGNEKERRIYVTAVQPGKYTVRVKVSGKYCKVWTTECTFSIEEVKKPAKPITPKDPEGPQGSFGLVKKEIGKAAPPAKQPYGTWSGSISESSISGNFVMVAPYEGTFQGSMTFSTPPAELKSGEIIELTSTVTASKSGKDIGLDKLEAAWSISGSCDVLEGNHGFAGTSDSGKFYPSGQGKYRVKVKSGETITLSSSPRGLSWGEGGVWTPCTYTYEWKAAPRVEPGDGTGNKKPGEDNATEGADMISADSD